MATGFWHRIQGAATFGWLRDRLLAERERWVLWLPVALASGIGSYFGLPVEPPFYVGLTGLAVSSVLLLVFRSR